MGSTHYAQATSGTKRRDDTSKLLRQLGCGKIGFMDDTDKHELTLAFEHRGRCFQYRVSAQGWANLYLKEKPYTHRRRQSRHDYEQAALRKGYIAINSIIRDWVKAQITAIECGILSIEAAFLPYMLTHDGRALIDRLAETEMLPKPSEPKVVTMR
jgi:hypothetical protein